MTSDGYFHRVKQSPDEGLWVRDSVDDRWFVWSPDGEFFGSDHDKDNSGLTDAETDEWPEARWGPSIAQEG